MFFYKKFLSLFSIIFLNVLMAEDGITTTSIETTTENSINSTTDPMDSIVLDDETLENFFYIYL